MGQRTRVLGLRQAFLMLVAGSESTASAIQATLLNVITTPRVYQRLKEEIRTAFQEGKATPIPYKEIKHLPYLQAIIYEGLHSHPPRLGLFPKYIPKGGELMHGVHIPEGTTICANLSSLLRSSTIFGKDTYLFRLE
ncbi:hypothetical protein P175DRAFT_0500334 [Aspergillus ochraceoroseus IBT 24754]|nr:uncharacterized protein P175DRAFT_0500334 [Aspergillus ochraceoroseus IBT 24754]PTU21434.1 hypothetical protein P175DRAFT_0500334 [Aspergillus ochraceoroseus IBT 24754]